MVTKKSSHKKTTGKKTRVNSSSMQSFRVYRDAPPFMTFRITKQTAYWSILLLVIFIVQLWILKIQLDISVITNAVLAR